MHPQTELLKKAVEQAFKIDWSELLTRKKPYEISHPRKIFIYLHQVDLDEHPTVTASIFGFDRSTAVFHREETKKKLDVGVPDIKEGVQAVRERFLHLKNERYGNN